MTRVFLSYAREDQERVERLYQNLAAAGFQPWMDVHDLQPGEEWEKAIQRGVQSADCFLACISPRSMQKDGVLGDEIRTAVEKWRKRRGNYRLIPVRLEDCEIPESLKHLQWFNLFHDEDWTRLAPAIPNRKRLLKWSIAGSAVAALLAAGLVIVPSRLVPGQIGVTLWRLRDPVPTDPPGAKMLVHVRTKAQPDALVPLVPERVGFGTPLPSGELVRISIASAQRGFLYIVDREQLKGTATGAPKLIFPSRTIRDGHNEVEPGGMVYIPAEPDEGLRLTKQSETYTGELLSILFAAQPLAGLEAGEDARSLDDAWFDARLKDWETHVTRAEYPSATSALLNRDPLPQTIFAGTPKRGAPLVVTYPIRLAQ